LIHKRIFSVKQKPLEYKINDLEKSPTVRQQKVEEKPQKRSITKITNQLVSKNLKSRHVSTEGETIFNFD